MEMNVNERLGLSAALIRCDNPKFVCFELQNHAKACIIRGEDANVPRRRPGHPTNTPKSLILLWACSFPS